MIFVCVECFSGRGRGRVQARARSTPMDRPRPTQTDELWQACEEKGRGPSKPASFHKAIWDASEPIAAGGSGA